MSALWYNSAQPTNIKDTYSQYDQVDFLVKTPPGREVVAGSFRLTAKLNITKAIASNPTVPVAIDVADAVFCNPFAGAHVFIQNATVSINDRTIESVAYYPRTVIMDTLAKNTLEELTACSDSAVEMKGNNGNVILAKADAPFSISPNLSMNKSSSNLPASKYPMMKMMLTLSSALTALYVSTPKPNPSTADDIVSLNYTLTQLQLHWIEVPEAKVQPKEVVFNTNYLVTQTVLSQNTTLNVVAPNPYDSVACSFIQQTHLNSLYADSNMCEYLRDITSVEFTVDNKNFGPLGYKIGNGRNPPYQDIAHNALKALKGNPDKNCIVNRVLSENGAFLMGMSYSANQNSKLGVVIQIDSATQFIYSSNPYNALLFVNGYATL